MRPTSLFELQKNLEVLLTEGDVVELRIFDKNGKKYCGWFDDRRKMAEAVLSRDGTAEGIYYSSNGCDRKMLAVSNNKIGKCIGASKESDIIRRRLFGTDVDPVRDAGISSTDAEKALALIRVKEVSDWLRTLGFPEPVLGDSGNGYHNDYFVDFPNTPEIKQVYIDAIKAIQAKFPKDAVDVQGFADANRIWKVYGTVVRKGDETPDRPYRRSQILSVPAKKEYVSLETLSKLAALAPKEEPKSQPVALPQHPTPKSSPSSGMIKKWTSDDLKHWLDTHGANIFRTKTDGNRTHFVLETCLMNSSHEGHHEASVHINSEGVIGYKCHHNSCAGVTWKDVRLNLDKEYAESQRRHAEWVQKQSTLHQEQLPEQPEIPKKIKPIKCTGFMNAGKGVEGIITGRRVAESLARGYIQWCDAPLEKTIKIVKKFCKLCQPPLDFSIIEPIIAELYDVPMALPVCDNMILAGLCETSRCKPMVRHRQEQERIAFLQLQEIIKKNKQQNPSPSSAPAPETSTPAIREYVPVQEQPSPATSRAASDKPFTPAIRMLLDTFLDGKKPTSRRVDEVRKLREKTARQLTMLEEELKQLENDEHQDHGRGY